ncbi:MAG TPA: aminotransferase class V-fold PLP-dependent enzyme [Bauldia sp.]|nr:aminotransferase class V-fold PLP-dependent enzyme [Bauldia sp.]
MPRLYLDYNATAPLRPEARAAMVEALSAVGNASSVHSEGRDARRRIEAARAAVAALAGGEAKLVTFTGGGTEANATVLTPDWSIAGKPHRIETLLVSGIEHVSVLSGGRFRDDQLRRIPVDGEGVVRLDALSAALAAAKGPVLLSLMLANNETGAIQPVADAARIAHAAGALVHTDAAQTAGRIPVDLRALGVDVLTLSAHKLGGPQGAGAILRASEDLVFAPLLTGGGQERRTRAGTENVAAIVGFGAAATAAGADVGRMPALARWRDELAGVVRGSIGKVTVFSESAPRLPQTLCFAVEGVSAETLVIALDLAGVAVSSGSACSSGKVAPSHVLAAMGIAQSVAKGAIRLSLGWDSKESDLHLFSTAWRHVLKHLAPNKPQAA